MSDRIALMRDGRFEQIGTPQELYDAPQSVFAAAFIGQTNLIRGVITGCGEGKALLEADGLSLPCVARRPVAVGDEMCLCVRVERLHYAAQPQGPIHIGGVLREHQYAGGVQRAVIELAGGRRLLAQRQVEAAQDCPVGSRVFVWWDPQTAALVPWEEISHEI